MKTTFKPKNGSTTMQIEAETDNERALLHATFGTYWMREKRKAFKDLGQKISSPRLRLVREYQDGKVAKILVKQVDYVSKDKITAKGWTHFSFGEDKKEQIYIKSHKKGAFIGYLTSRFHFYYIPYTDDIDLYDLQYWTNSFLQSCEQEGYFDKEDSEYIAKKIVIGLRRMYPHYNFNCRKYTVLTIEELGETIKKITALPLR